MGLGSPIVLSMDGNLAFGQKFMMNIEIIAMTSIWWPLDGFGLTNCVECGLEFNFWSRIYEIKS
jgi:hypothetical protein